MAKINEEQVKEAVRREIQKRMQPISPETMEESHSAPLEEGVADSFVRGMSAVLGGAGGSLVGGAAGSMLSLPALLATIGLMNPLGLAIWTGATVGFGALGASVGAKQGYRAGRESTGDTLHASLKQLDRNVNARDGILSRISRSSNPEAEMQRSKKDLRKLTKQQIAIAANVKKQLDRAVREGEVDSGTYQEITKLHEAASEGRLSEISDKKIR